MDSVGDRPKEVEHRGPFEELRSPWLAARDGEDEKGYQ